MKTKRLPKYVSCGNEFVSNGMVNILVSFIPGETIKCNPPYEKGKMDSLWVKFNQKKPRPKPTEKEAWEKKIGIKLLPYKQD
jgi:hypothetical protein